MEIVFVVEIYKAYPNQWQFLSQIEKNCGEEIEDIVKNNSLNKGVVSKVKEQTNIVKMPKRLKVINSNGNHIPKSSLPPVLINKTIQLATFTNPEFFKAKSKRLSTYKIPRIIDCTENYTDYIILPRGCLDRLKALMLENGTELLVKGRFRPVFGILFTSCFKIFLFENRFLWYSIHRRINCS